MDSGQTLASRDNIRQGPNQPPLLPAQSFELSPISVGEDTDRHEAPTPGSSSAGYSVLEPIESIQVEDDVEPSPQDKNTKVSNRFAIPITNADEISEARAINDAYMPLDWKPLQLQTWVLTCVFIFFALCFTSIVALATIQHKNRRILHFKEKYNYFAVHYTPTIVGTITSVTWQSVVSTFGRFTPFMTLASSESLHTGRSAKLHRTLGAAYIGAPIGHSLFNRHILLTFAFASQLFMNFLLVPLKASLLVIANDDPGFQIEVSTPVSTILGFLYLFLMTAVLWILIKVSNRSTGLKTDPNSIAEQILLFSHCNCLEDFQGLEWESAKEIWPHLKGLPGKFRLGYWKSPSGVIWHGIGRLEPTHSDSPNNWSPLLHDAQQQDQSLLGVQSSNSFGETGDRGQIRLKVEEYQRKRHTNLELPRTVNGLPVKDPLRYRFRAPLLYLGVFAMFFWTFLAIGSLSASIVAICKLSRNPSIHVQQVRSVHGPLPWNLAFRTAPAFFVNLFRGFANNADIYYRMVQPYVGMCEPKPATENLLLDYPYAPPILVTFSALRKKHWKVAGTSLLSFVAVYPAILTGSIFNVIPDGNGFAVNTSLGALYGTIAFLALYSISIPFFWPTQKRLFPRPVIRLIDVISFCYASRILDDPAFSSTDPTDRPIHLVSRIHLQKAKYVFGLYKGRNDGGLHMGFDVAERDVDGRLQSSAIKVYGDGDGQANEKLVADGIAKRQPR
ncbi:hypothetical protein B7463_g8603, partial [Scytalidium lignicola]